MQKGTEKTVLFSQFTIKCIHNTAIVYFLSSWLFCMNKKNDQTREKKKVAQRYANTYIWWIIQSNTIADTQMSSMCKLTIALSKSVRCIVKKSWKMHDISAGGHWTNARHRRNLCIFKERVWNFKTHSSFSSAFESWRCIWILEEHLNLRGAFELESWKIKLDSRKEKETEMLRNGIKMKLKWTKIIESKKFKIHCKTSEKIGYLDLNREKWIEHELEELTKSRFLFDAQKDS